MCVVDINGRYFVRLCVCEMLNGICYTDIFFFQAEDGIRDLVRSRGLGDVYKRQRGDHLPKLKCRG